MAPFHISERPSWLWIAWAVVLGLVTSSEAPQRDRRWRSRVVPSVDGLTPLGLKQAD
jgi:hypothetical protein